MGIPLIKMKVLMKKEIDTMAFATEIIIYASYNLYKTGV